MPVEVLPGQRVALKDLIDESRAGNPHLLNVHWEEFHAGMERFLKAIDTYALRAKKEIGDRAQDHVTRVRDLTAQKDETERQIQLEQTRESEMLQTIEVERHTIADLTTSLTRLQASLNKIKETASNLDNEYASINTDIRAERATKERQSKVLAENQEMDISQLKVLENALGLKVQGVGGNRLLFLFTLIDPSKPMREFSFVIDVDSTTYIVPQCDPPVAHMPELVAQLNEDRDMYGFIKKVRKAFVALVPTPQPNGSLSTSTSS